MAVYLSDYKHVILHNKIIKLIKADQLVSLLCFDLLR